RRVRAGSSRTRASPNGSPVPDGRRPRPSPGRGSRTGSWRSTRRPSGGGEGRCYHEAVLGLWIVLGLLLVAVLYAVYAFNRLVRTRNRVDNAWSQIDVQLRRRYDLIPNLVEAVKGYAAHERGVFDHAAEARAQAQEASTVGDQAHAENQTTQALRRLIAGAESYPELK